MRWRGQCRRPRPLYPGLHFIFGQAQVNGQATILALAHLHSEFWGQSPDPQRSQERAIKEVVHELGLDRC